MYGGQPYYPAQPYDPYLAQPHVVPGPVTPWETPEEKERKRKEEKERDRERKLTAIALGAAAIIPIIPIFSILAGAPLLVALVLFSTPSLEPTTAIALLGALALTLCVAVALVFILGVPLVLGLVILYPDLMPDFLNRALRRSPNHSRPQSPRTMVVQQPPSMPPPRWGSPPRSPIIVQQPPRLPSPHTLRSRSPSPVVVQQPVSPPARRSRSRRPRSRSPPSWYQRPLSRPRSRAHSPQFIPPLPATPPPPRHLI